MPKNNQNARNIVYGPGDNDYGRRKTIGDLRNVRVLPAEMFFIPYSGPKPKNRVQLEVGAKSHFRAKLHRIDDKDVWVFEAIDCYIFPDPKTTFDYELIKIKDYNNLCGYKKDNRVWILKFY